MTLDYASSQMAAAFKMAFDLPGWRDELDRTIDGVFRSAFAFLVAAPLAIASALLLRRVALQVDPATENAGLFFAPMPTLITAQLAILALDWALSIGVLIIAANLLGAGRRIADLIVGYNWGQALVVGLQILPLGGLAAGGPMIGQALGLPSLALSLAIYWGLLRRSLAAAVGPTVVLIAALIMVGAGANALVSFVALAVVQPGAGL